jgi:hypothetical protein
VAYDPKVAAFCREIGYPYCMPAELHNKATLETLGQLWSRQQQMRESIAERRTELRQRFDAVEASFDASW